MKRIDSSIGRSHARVCLSGEDLDWLGGLSLCASMRNAISVTLTPAMDVARADDLPEKFIGFCIDSGWIAEGDLSAHGLVKTVDVPSPGGLGTSSGLLIATVRALSALDVWGGPDCVQAAFEFEFGETHGGGMDHISTASRGAFLTAGRDCMLPRLVGHLEIGGLATTLVHTGLWKSCADHIGELRSSSDSGNSNLMRYIREASACSLRGWEALVTRDLPGLHKVMRAAHDLMANTQNMSTPEIESIRRSCEAATGLPFKLTGSGNGGCLFTIHSEKDATLVRRSLLSSEFIPPEWIYQFSIG